MTELELLVALHKDGNRQGPGSTAATLQALEFVQLDRKENLQIADIGCGTGSSTLVLAAHSNWKITAIDLFPVVFNNLESRALEKGLQAQITTEEASMDQLAFEQESLDLIWSEGAIYNMGFERGIAYWKQFLKPGGWLAVSELSWTTAERPQAIHDYWTREYPEIGTIAEKITVLEQQGFAPQAHFILPYNCWMEEYYQPVLDRLPAFIAQHPGALTQKVAENERKEVEMFRKYHSYYNYGFYIAQKV